MEVILKIQLKEKEYGNIMEECKEIKIKLNSMEKIIRYQEFKDTIENWIKEMEESEEIREMKEITNENETIEGNVETNNNEDIEGMEDIEKEVIEISEDENVEEEIRNIEKKLWKLMMMKL
jgi:hypothetical protein